MQTCRPRSFRSRRLEEPTSETTRETEGEQEEAIAGDVRSSWKKAVRRIRHPHGPDPWMKTTGTGEHTPRTCHTSGEAWPSQV
ncbi:hypothetical protein NDU88_001960 [Pleurodeles waltl]|uniref:Uncharacterized protein n=1 Tax=Pleurodeles waltl TaxID=8319 RepID=A0AAV7UXK3_PLEWA|nr:hypothetical protein NDU88_001960 [Pleurodeles waltl]